MTSSATHGFVLVVLSQPDNARFCLEAASQITNAFDEAQIEVLCIPADWTKLLTAEEVVSKSRQAALQAATAKCATAIHTIYDNWHSENYEKIGRRTVWNAPLKVNRGWLCTRARGADLIVLASPRASHDFYGRQTLRELLIDAERPILVVSGAPPPVIGRSIAILWDNEPQTAKAVLDAMPLIARAKRVFIFTAHDNQGQQLPQPFIDHGVSAQIHRIQPTFRALGQALLDQAHGLHADLLVVGAYVHHPLIEILVGGVTRYMLSHADLPVLMRH